MFVSRVYATLFNAFGFTLTLASKFQAKLGGLRFAVKPLLQALQFQAFAYLYQNVLQLDVLAT